MDCLHNPVDLHERPINNTEATFCVRVSGDSMRDAGIVDDFILIVDTSHLPRAGDIVAANIDEQYILKRLHQLYASGLLFQKCGVMLGEISPAGTE